MRVVTLLNPGARGTLTDAEQVVGAVTLGGTVALVVFLGVGGGAFGGVIWVVVRERLPESLAPRIMLAGVISTLVGSFAIIEATNSDFKVFDPAVLNVAMFMLLIGLCGSATAYGDWVLRRRLPGGTRAGIIYGILVGAAAFFVSGAFVDNSPRVAGGFFGVAAIGALLSWTWYAALQAEAVAWGRSSFSEPILVDRSTGGYPMIQPSQLSVAIAASLAALLLLAGCSSASPASTDSPDASEEPSAPQQEAYTLQQAVATTFNVTTTSLKATGFLQTEFTCEGTDSSPHIAWGDVPSGTQSIVVLAEDLDLAGSVASHWIVWGLPPDTRELPAGASGSEALPPGAVEGVHTYGEPGYKGPCPPPRVVLAGSECAPTGFDSNPYRWSVYALEKEASLGPDSTRDDLLKAINGSIIASGSIDVKYLSKTLIKSPMGCRIVGGG